MKIKKKIVLVGMMGSGKSTIGALLSKKMNIKFILLTNTKIPRRIVITTTTLIMIFSGFIELPMLVFL